MAKTGVYAADLSIDDTIRIDTQIWRVARVDHCGQDEVELLLVKPDDSDQLVVARR